MRGDARVIWFVVPLSQRGHQSYQIITACTCIVMMGGFVRETENCSVRMQTITSVLTCTLHCAGSNMNVSTICHKLSVVDLWKILQLQIISFQIQHLRIVVEAGDHMVAYVKIYHSRPLGAELKPDACSY